MLTQDQLTKLEPLTQHPRFGQLLKDAIEIWKREDIIPGYNNSGLDWGDRPNWKDNKNWKLTYKKCPCLIGASLVDKEITSDYPSGEVENHFKLIYNEIEGLWRSFDMKNTMYCSEDAITFASQVREIVKPINYINI